MIRRIFQFAVAVALAVAVSGHWAILQSVAWVQMAVSYSQQAPLREALKMTFDGAHPCQLCKVVREGKKSEREKNLRKVDTKLDFICRDNALSVVAVNPPPVALPLAQSARSRSEAPLLPPPRRA